MTEVEIRTAMTRILRGEKATLLVPVEAVERARELAAKLSPRLRANLTITPVYRRCDACEERKPDVRERACPSPEVGPTARDAEPGDLLCDACAEILS